MIIAARNVVTGTPGAASSCSTSRRELKCSDRPSPVSPSPPRKEDAPDAGGGCGAAERRCEIAIARRVGGACVEHRVH